ncbi:DUF3619 family protein [Aromatoleum evansii]|uniref:DUF3619 family protein n=1 Tax=Aromatoleum evansii TaxID=59406 RepID=A0ABZ1AIU0_AROEV|nr:DUF3619 family protein [Aromatoleum evansii]NMG28495.1 DUF3619 family protein [Aromatoleum evansii]WRL45395.1 DUF3619 family protein [Aromatoleum evansii]
MNEEAFARKVAAQLSVAARGVDGDVADRLRLARERALAAHRPALPSVGARIASALRRLFPPMMRPAAVAAAILVAVLAGDYWTTWLRVNEMEEVDTALLIDDLPIDAYLDSNFKAWLQDDSQS